MKRMAMQRTAAVAALCAVALLGGCDNSGPQNATGTWRGSLTLRLVGGSALDGGLTLVLDQRGDSVAGAAEWTPIGETQSIAGPMDGIYITLRLVFRCAKDFETTELAGTIDGDSITIEDAAGKACTLGGAPIAVDGGAGSLTRDADGRPL